MLLSIDPGLRGCGVAAWGADKQLIRAAYVGNPDGADWCSMARAVDSSFGGAARLAIEIPQVYVQARWKGDPNDLIQLAGLVGVFCQLFYGRGGHTLYKPAEWKGQVKKRITELRAKKRLTNVELANVQLPTGGSLAHNVWDAVGLGLHHLSRH